MCGWKCYLMLQVIVNGIIMLSSSPKEGSFSLMCGFLWHILVLLSSFKFHKGMKGQS
ncbi:hypothetical protein CFP56_033784 [Quercus suber]|uniref:Uncharacterized protein n=1 Tax=Quercus suber TaxID=58331 RepID=A0AAW0LRT0_QUESU